MRDGTEMERVALSNAETSDRLGAVAQREATDSRIVSETRTEAGRRSDVGAQGEQFILASWATMAAGLWLVIAPFVLTFAGYAPRARANDLVLGALIASMGATRVFGNYRSGRLNQLISAFTVLPGVWLVIAPFVLSYSDRIRPTRSDIIAGIAVILFALWSYLTSRTGPDSRER